MERATDALRANGESFAITFTFTESGPPDAATITRAPGASML